MMTLNEAVMYGKRTGVKYYVLNSKDGIEGGAVTLESAKEMKAQHEADLANDPWNKNLLPLRIKKIR